MASADFTTKNSVAVSKDDLEMYELDRKFLKMLLKSVSDHHQPTLQLKITDLKQGDGESWAVGELLQRAIFINGLRKTLQIDE